MNNRYYCQTVDPSIIDNQDLKEEFIALRKLSENWSYTDDPDLFEHDRSLYQTLKDLYNLPADPFNNSQEDEGSDDEGEGEPDEEGEDVELKPGMWVEQEGNGFLARIISIDEENQTLKLSQAIFERVWPIDERIIAFEEGWEPDPMFPVGSKVYVKAKENQGPLTVSAIAISRKLDPKQDEYYFEEANGPVKATRLTAAIPPHRPKSTPLPDMDTIIKELLKKLKITESNLDENLLKKFNATRNIRIKLPDRNTPSIPDQQIPHFFRILDDVIGGKNVFLVGGAGTGKTTLAQKVADALNRQFQTINCNQWTSPLDILGGETMEGYRDGKLVQAWRSGQVLILDELPKLDPNTAGVLNEALAKSADQQAIIQTPKGEAVKKHDDFAVIATGNIFPNIEDLAYGANNKQDLSLLDRFVSCVYWIEENHELEQRITGNKMIWSIANRLRKEIKEKQYESQVSLRWMITARDAYNLEMDRVNHPDQHDVKANEGKTLEDVLVSFINTFDPVQRTNLLDVIRYATHFAGYAYRKYDPNKTLF
jgi:cobaltochelatase CobS